MKHVLIYLPSITCQRTKIPCNMSSNHHRIQGNLHKSHDDATSSGSSSSPWSELNSEMENRHTTLICQVVDNKPFKVADGRFLDYPSREASGMIITAATDGGRLTEFFHQGPCHFQFPHEESVGLHTASRASGITLPQLHPSTSNQLQEFDVVVLGGGGAAVSAAQEAAKLGCSVCLCSYNALLPSASSEADEDGILLGDFRHGQVGAVLQGILHHSASLADTVVHEAPAFGWSIHETSTGLATSSSSTKTWMVDWAGLVANIANMKSSLHSEYIQDLGKLGVRVIQSLPRITSSKTITIQDGTSAVQNITGSCMILAPFLNTKFPDIPGVSQYGHAVQDVFQLKNAPGKTLIIGTSSGSLEAAGILVRLGYSVTVLARGTPPKKYDKDMRERILKNLASIGVTFKDDFNLIKVDQADEHQVNSIQPQLQATFTKDGVAGQFTELFDTVLASCGIVAHIGGLGLENLGVLREEETGQIIVDENDATSLPGVYAVGGITNKATLNFTAAEHSACLLCNRLFGTSKATCNYDFAPHAVFTPLEYGFVGLTEDEAINHLGMDRVAIYEKRFMPTHYNVLPKSAAENSRECYAKIICDKFREEQMIGMHIVGPKAAEIIQGFALAMSLRARKWQLDTVIGLHPTAAENLIQTIPKEEAYFCCDEIADALEAGSSYYFPDPSPANSSGMRDTSLYTHT